MQKIKLSNFVNRWKEDKVKRIKISTLCVYELMLVNHIIPYFGDFYMDEINEDQLQSFICYKTDRLSSKTIKDLIVLIKMILKQGARNNFCLLQQFDLIFPKSNIEKRIVVFTKQEQKRLTDYLIDNFSFINLGLLICLYTGIRIGEISALKWSDIELQNNVISISRTLQRIYLNGRTKKIEESCKTDNSIRTVPLCRALIKFIKPLKKLINEDFYVISNSSNPIEPRTYRIYYKNILENLGLPIIKFHATRHSFATRLIESKADVKTVSALLGHASVSTTLNLYVHPNDEQKRKSIEHAYKLING